MPRDSTSDIDSTWKARSAWRTAVMVTPHPRDLASKAAPRCAKTPADEFVPSLIENHDVEWGRGSADVRRNIVLKLWVEEQKDSLHGPFEVYSTYTLKLRREPGMFIRSSTVTLDAYTGGDIAAPSAPLWTRLSGLTSMADERTQSTYTWLNSNLRNRQSVQTVTRMIQIRNWYLQQTKKAIITRQLTVKFRDIGPILGIPPTVSQADGGGLGFKSEAVPGMSQSAVVIVNNDTKDEHEDGDIGGLLDSDSEAEGPKEHPDWDDSSEDLDAVVYEDL